MSFSPDTEYSARTINSIDRFAALTVKASEEAARRARGMVSTMGFLCLVLFLSLLAVAWRANAMNQENDRLIEELRAERAARVEATLSAKGVEMKVANFALDTESGATSSMNGWRSRIAVRQSWRNWRGMWSASN